jgi:hypothetical protein
MGAARLSRDYVALGSNPVGENPSPSPGKSEGARMALLIFWRRSESVANCALTLRFFIYPANQNRSPYCNSAASALKSSTPFPPQALPCMQASVVGSSRAMRSRVSCVSGACAK